jgi:hypothetical protein
MTGFCDGCSVPGVMKELSDTYGAGQGELWKDPELSAVGLATIGRLAGMGVCERPPTDVGDGDVMCQHPNAERMCQVADAMETAVTDVVLTVGPSPVTQ